MSCVGQCAGLLLLACCLLAGNVLAADKGVGARLRFDIASQPLALALRLYADRTGKSVFFDTALAAGKVAPPLQGEFTEEEALERLLEGSGLAAMDASDSAFTLVPRQAGRADALQARSTAPAGAGEGEGDMQPAPDWRRARQLQAALEQVLCRESLTYPGTYRALIRLWLDTDGRVRSGGLLGSTGMDSRDQAIGKALKKLAAGPQESSVLTRPVVILLVPRTAGTADVCLDRAQD